jgi:hypothetical protein
MSDTCTLYVMNNLCIYNIRIMKYHVQSDRCMDVNWQYRYKTWIHFKIFGSAILCELTNIKPHWFNCLYIFNTIDCKENRLHLYVIVIVLTLCYMTWHGDVCWDPKPWQDSTKFNLVLQTTTCHSYFNSLFKRLDPLIFLYHVTIGFAIIVFGINVPCLTVYLLV